MKLSNNEKLFYSRHLLLNEVGEAGQLKLKASKVLVVGTGGLGVPVLQYLVGAGVGTIGIVDGDVVNISNLQRQILFNSSDVGLPKAQVAAQKLAALNPNITIEPYIEFLNTSNAEELVKKYDVVVDASDNFPTRYLVNDACVITGKPLVFGSIFKFEGQVSVFNYKNSATYRCLYPVPPSPGEMPSCSEIGVLGVLPGIIGCYQANEVLKILLEIGKVLAGELLTINTQTNEQLVFKFTRTDEAEIKALDADYDLFCGITSDVETLDYDEYLSNEEAYTLIDVRDKEEHELNNIGGVNIPLSQIHQEINNLTQSKPFVFYCQTGARSKQAIQKVAKQHPSLQLYNLEGVVL